MGFGQIAPQAGEFADADDGLAADGAPDRLQRMAIGGAQRELEAVAAFAQTNAGDMSPNLNRRPGSGPTEDEFENTRIIGGEARSGGATPPLRCH